MLLAELVVVVLPPALPLAHACQLSGLRLLRAAGHSPQVALQIFDEFAVLLIRSIAVGLQQLFLNAPAVVALGILLYQAPIEHFQDSRVVSLGLLLPQQLQQLPDFLNTNPSTSSVGLSFSCFMLDEYLLFTP